MTLKIGKKVFAAMSGGVDSSVAAMLLKNQGYEVIGVFMRCFNLDGCAEKDAEDARRVAGHLGIPFYVWDFEKEYKEKVVDYMVEGYRNGLTPNPDVMCNREIKFGLFLEKALEMGADYVATGHYVRLKQIKNPTAYSLYKARDLNKDQSYFLWTLTRAQLKHCLFPIGAYLKTEVREMAHQAGLPTAAKKDSQGICFLGKVTLADFLKRYIPEKRGAVVTLAGEKLGEHKGVHFYTIGQRHIGVANHHPIFVADKDLVSNTLKVAESSDDPSLFEKEVSLTDINLVNQLPSKEIYVSVRYRQPPRRAVFQNGKIIFEKAAQFVASGQSAVFYSRDNELLGGGVIL